MSQGSLSYMEDSGLSQPLIPSKPLAPGAEVCKNYTRQVPDPLSQSLFQVTDYEYIIIDYDELYNVAMSDKLLDSHTLDKIYDFAPREIIQPYWEWPGSTPYSEWP